MSALRVVTLGCRLNHAESARLAAELGELPDTVLVNTCAVTAEAVRHSLRALRQARRNGARTIATGCAATIDPNGFAALADEVIPNANKPQGAVIGRHTRAFVPVQNGCDHACTFCVIPQGRGPSRSRPVEDVVEEVALLVQSGVSEVVLTGVDLTSYAEPGLGALAAALLERTALPRLRLSSLDGAEIDPLLFELLTSEQRVMPHVHLSLQSGDDLVLKRMKRRHSRRQALALIDNLKTKRPVIAIGADIIAGFPTESEEAHRRNLTLVEACDVVHGHVFPYSPRPGTPAARMPQVEPSVVRARAAELRIEVAARRERWLQRQVGAVREVLAEQDGTGHAPDFARFRLPEGTRPGSVVALRAVRLEDGLLVGEPA
jgi:threonylcarbamoyladenosine tRNA methylthiotransferase MtaB